MSIVADSSQKPTDNSSQQSEVINESLLGGKYSVLRTSDNWHLATVTLEFTYYILRYRNILSDLGSNSRTLRLAIKKVNST